jgi:site-specific recombinase XerD
MESNKDIPAKEKIRIFDEAYIYKRGEYWQFKMWLSGENKYAFKSLRTRNRTRAIERGKEMYLEIYANKKLGKSYYSINTKEGVKKYIANREKDLKAGLIVAGRLVTIKSHLQHWLDFIGLDTKLKELERTDCEDYYYERLKKSGGKVKLITVQNEQSTINACMKYLFKNKETLIDGFEFKRLPKIDKNNDTVRRSTFTEQEFKRMVKVMRSYCSKSNKLTKNELFSRELVRYFILVAAASGMRSGEQRQLRWSDVELERVTANKVPFLLAKIRIRAETSKVRTSRFFYCKGGEYFEKLATLTKPDSKNCLIFSADGETEISKRTLLYHFRKIMELAEIEDLDKRDLVPYSLRHYMITQRIMSGLDFR